MTILQYFISNIQDFPVDAVVKNLSANVGDAEYQSLHWGDALEWGVATASSIFL